MGGNERNEQEDACVRDERTGCSYLIAPPRRPLSLTLVSGSLYLVISFV